MCTYRKKKVYFGIASCDCGTGKPESAVGWRPRDEPILQFKSKGHSVLPTTESTVVPEVSLFVLF